MDKNAENAIRRARKLAGVTQEKAAEMSGYSVDSIQAWEAGTRRASVEVLDMLALCYGAPWLSYVYMRELSQSGPSGVALNFTPGEPLPQAVLSLLDKVTKFTERHSDRRLIALAADGRIDTGERQEYDAIMEDLCDICEAAMALKFAQTDGPEK